ncbi:MAG: ABC transporter permease [Thermoanaerobaculia bacterium]|nr:ABC transporter permease [Thermoanaerobaculia bacterium]
MTALLFDLRLALRQLLRTPGFTLVVVLTLALGIGSLTAIYSMADGVLFRPLPYEDPDELVSLFGYHVDSGAGRWNTSYPDFEDYRDRATSLRLSVVSPRVANVLGAGDRPERLTIAWASHDLFELLGLQVIEGRDLLPEDDRLGAEPVAVLAETFWRERFGGDRQTIGRSLRIDGIPTTIVGVVAGAALPEGAQMWLPVEQLPGTEHRGVQNLAVIGRLTNGIDLPAANAEIVRISEQIAEEYPEDNKVRRSRIESMHEATVGGVRTPILTVLGAAAFLLLIVGANVSNLLLHRAAERRREVATRAALGASSPQLMRQFLAESSWLVLGGALLGIAVAKAGIGLLLTRVPTNLPRAAEVGLDLRVMLVTVGASAAVAVVFGVVPAGEVMGRNLFRHLGAGARGVRDTASAARVRRVLVVTEVALAVVLVIGSLLLVRSMMRLYDVETGFDPSHVLAVDLELPTAYVSDEWPQTVAFYDRLLGELEALPGVQSVGAAHQHAAAPGWGTSFAVEGEPEPEEGRRPEANFRPVTEGYFETLDIPLVEGRGFASNDRSDGGGVVVVNEAFVRQHLPPDRPAVGRSLLRSSWWIREIDRFEIVGVVRDVRFSGRASPPQPAMYFLHRQNPTPGMTVLLETETDPLALLPEVRSTIWSIDPELPLGDASTMDERLAGTLAYRSFLTQILSTFAVSALFLAALGLYGILAYSTARRTREIGLRMALGATARSVVTLVVGQGIRMTAFGLLAGMAGAIALTRFLQTLLFEIDPYDPTTFGLVGLGTLLVALLAAFLPAHRAISIEPTRALQEE